MDWAGCVNDDDDNDDNDDDDDNDDNDDNDDDISRSRLVINSFTLLTRLGGVIGFTKELLWLFLLSWGVLKCAASLLPCVRRFT